MNIIFLDFDGVLNSDSYHKHEIFGGRDFTVSDQLLALRRDPEKMLDPKAVRCLKDICDASKSRVVISSSWRVWFTTPRIINMFESNGWKNPPIIGATPNLYPEGKSRGDEINSWLKENNKEHVRYIILDDVNNFHPYQKGQLFLTDIETGLTSEHIQSVLQMISNNEYDDDCNAIVANPL